MTIAFVTGTQEGTTTVHVTNTSTGATAVLTVIVIDGHKYIDLGLSSGTLWATMNIGASTPEDYGDYFAWGETAPKVTTTGVTTSGLMVVTIRWRNTALITIMTIMALSTIKPSWIPRMMPPT